MQISMIPFGIKWSGRVRSLFGVVLAWVPFHPRPFFLLWGLTSLGSSLHLAVVLGLYQVENPVKKHEQPSHRKCRLKVPDRFAIGYGESQVVPLG